VTGRRRGGARRDAGSAVVEFVTLGVLMLVPLVYLVVVLGRLQAAAFGTDAAAREAVRAFGAATDERTGRREALAGVRLALLDQGFDVDPGRALQLTCSGRPCLTPGARVTSQVAVEVVLPGIPGLVDRVVPLHVTVRSEATAAVGVFRSRQP
jgi:hypothetical protein